MSNESIEIGECCNSGCNNCVLDSNQRQCNTKSKLTNGSKINLFNGVYQKYKVISIEVCTETVHRFRFKIASDNVNKDEHIIEVPPTYHLFIRAPTNTANESKNDKNTKENYISRMYTPIETDISQLSFDILVRFEPNGRMSTYLRKLKIDDITEWKGCYGSFVWSPNPLKYKYLVCICQGVAIAPMYSLISSILSNDDDETLIYLLVCFKDLKHYLLRTELVQFAKYWNFRFTVYFSQFLHDEKCDKKVKNCSCIQLRYNEIICPYRLDHNALQQFYCEREPNSIFTLISGRKNLENLVKTVQMKNYHFLQ